jgi:hypothetical protein
VLDRKLSQILFRAPDSTVKLTVKRRRVSSKSRFDAGFQASKMMERGRRISQRILAKWSVF